MIFSLNVLGGKFFNFLLMYSGEGGVSFGAYDVKKSLTPLGWAFVIIFSITLIFGAIYLTAKIFKKPKLK